MEDHYQVFLTNSHTVKLKEIDFWILISHFKRTLHWDGLWRDLLTSPHFIYLFILGCSVVALFLVQVTKEDGHHSLSIPGDLKSFHPSTPPPQLTLIHCSHRRETTPTLGQEDNIRSRQLS